MTRKRMILSLDDDLHSLLMELSRVTGTPAATFVTDLLEETKPRIRTIIDTLRLAREGSIEDAHNMLTRATEQSLVDLKRLNDEVKSDYQDKKKKS